MQIQNNTWRAERYGIRVIDREESYTSKASFLYEDEIPTYGQTKETPKFSGRRIKRGLYKAKDGNIINADLNGSANILRKEFPDAFLAHTPKFNEVVIMRHPDFEKDTLNRKKQAEKPKKISKAKAKHLKAKAKT